MNILTGNKDAIMKQVQSDPRFHKFVEENKGKTPEQIARENNIDPSILRLIR